MTVIDVQEIQTIFTANLKALERGRIKYENSMEAGALKVERAFEKSNRRIAAQATRLQDDLKRALVGGAVILAGREVVKLGDQYTDMVNKVAAASKVSGLDGASLELLAERAAVARSELSPYVDLYARVLRSSQAYAESEAQVARVSDLVAKSFSAGGAAATEQAAGVQQLGQALNGILGGDELRSVRENAPLLFEAIADGLGVTSDKLKQLGADGELTGERVFKAIQSQGEQLDAIFAVTLPRATEEGARAIERLQLAIGRFVNDSGIVEEGAAALAAVIDFLTRNLDALVDVLVIGAAALTGAFGAAAIGAYVSNIAKVTKGLSGAARAMAGLRAATLVFGGPVAAAIGVAAAALAYFALQGDDAAGSIDRLESALDRYDRATVQLKADTEKLTELNRDLENAIKDQRPEIEATRRADIAAINERIAKNRELQTVLAATARDEAATAQRQLGDLRLPAGLRDGFGDARGFDRARADKIAAGATPDVNGFVGVTPAEVAAAEAKIQAEITADVIRRADAGERLSDTDRDILKFLRERAELEARVADARQRVNDLTPTRDDGFGPVAIGAENGRAPSGSLILNPNAPAYNLGNGKATTKTETKDTARADALKLLIDLETEYNAARDDERAAAKRDYAARLAQIEAAKLSQAEADDARLKALGVYDAAIAEIDKDEADRAAEKRREDDEARARELDIIDEVKAAREGAFGRVADLIERDYARRAAFLALELSDAQELADALVALEETKQEELRQIRERAIEDAAQFADDGSDPYSREIDDIRDEAERRVDAIRDAYGDEIEAHREAQDAIVAIQEAAADRVEQIQNDRLRNYVDATGDIFGDLGSILKSAGQEQSTAYKLAIGAQKVFTLASIGMNIAEAVGKAVAVGFPQNIPFIAAATAQGAQAMALLTNAKGYQSGGFTGYGADHTAAGVVHYGEHVNPAPTVRHYGRDIMEAIEKRRIPKAVIAAAMAGRGMQRGGYVDLSGLAAGAGARAASVAAGAGGIAGRSDLSVTFGGNTITLPDGTSSDLAARFEAELRASERRTVSAMRAALDGDVASLIARGGVATTDALESAYRMGR